MTASTPKQIAIIGSGLAGSVLAMFLGRRGHTVTAFEKHGDPRLADQLSGRSINLTLTKRGLDALDEVGALAPVLQASVPAYHRMVHLTSGETVCQKYDEAGEALHSIDRMKLNRVLIDHLEKMGVAKIRFQTRIEGIDLNKKELTLSHGSSKSKEHYDIILGADGAFSPLRFEMMKHRGFNYLQEYSDHANIELRVSPQAGWTGDRNAVHVWPRKNIMLIAFPNPDGGLTLTLQVPNEGPMSADEFRNPLLGRELFGGLFPEISSLIPDLEAQLQKHRPIQMVSIKCGKWYFGDSISLLGDAAHAVFPSYGQGANSAFEDCLILNRLLDETGESFSETFRRFYELRKPSTDALCDLSREHYFKLRNEIASDQEAMRLQYRNIAFTHLPYHTVYQKGGAYAAH